MCCIIIWVNEITIKTHLQVHNMVDPDISCSVGRLLVIPQSCVIGRYMPWLKTSGLPTVSIAISKISNDSLVYLPRSSVRRTTIKASFER